MFDDKLILLLFGAPLDHPDRDTCATDPRALRRAPKPTSSQYRSDDEVNERESAEDLQCKAL